MSVIEDDISLLKDLMKLDLRLGSCILELAASRESVKQQIESTRERLGPEGLEKFKEST